MEKEDKRAWAAFLIVLLIGAGSFWYLSTPYEEELNLLPNANIANIVNGNYTRITEISLSGTAVTVPLEEYGKKFKTDKKTAILLDNPYNDQAEIYYVTKEDTVTYVAKERLFRKFHGSSFVERSSGHISVIYGMDGGVGFAWMIVTLFLSWIAFKIQKPDKKEK